LIQLREWGVIWCITEEESTDIWEFESVDREHELGREAYQYEKANQMAFGSMPETNST
jgi:hypothetical protein